MLELVMKGGAMGHPDAAPVRRLADRHSLKLSRESRKVKGQGDYICPFFWNELVQRGRPETESRYLWGILAQQGATSVIHNADVPGSSPGVATRHRKAVSES